MIELLYTILLNILSYIYISHILTYKEKIYLLKHHWSSTKTEHVVGHQNKTKKPSINLKGS